jgi:hypothetical protein
MVKVSCKADLNQKRIKILKVSLFNSSSGLSLHNQMFLPFVSQVPSLVCAANHNVAFQALVSTQLVATYFSRKAKQPDCHKPPC